MKDLSICLTTRPLSLYCQKDIENIHSQHGVKPQGEDTAFFLLHKRSGHRQGQERRVNTQIKFLSLQS